MLLKPNELRNLAADKRKENKRFFQKLKSHPPSDLDQTVIALDEEAFRKIDCLNCANCCKTISPIFKPKDIERIGKALKIRPAEVVERYLKLDEDDDYVTKSSLCPFLGEDNHCSVYDSRPAACREYPHTNRRKFHQALKVTEKNVAVCPAVYHIVEQLKQIY